MMQKVWVAAGSLAVILLATEVEADTIVLKNGQNVWGTEAYEEGDSVIVVRPGGSVKIPKADVSRIDRARSSLPPYYIPPSAQTGPSGAGAPPGAPGVPGAAPAAGGTGASAAGPAPSGGDAGQAPAPSTPGTPSTPATTGGTSPAPASGPSQLPPPPPPPQIGR